MLTSAASGCGFNLNSETRRAVEQKWWSSPNVTWQPLCPQRSERRTLTTMSSRLGGHLRILQIPVQRLPFSAQTTMQRATAARAATHASCLYVIRDNQTGREENASVFFLAFSHDWTQRLQKKRSTVIYMLVYADIKRSPKGDEYIFSPQIFKWEWRVVISLIMTWFLLMDFHFIRAWLVPKFDFRWRQIIENSSKIDNASQENWE